MDNSGKTTNPMHHRCFGLNTYSVERLKLLGEYQHDSDILPNILGNRPKGLFSREFYDSIFSKPLSSSEYINNFIKHL